ncbi:hypothetical protein ABDK00_008585 [Niabella insulamsoli]|uniref:hypothetical protein n=1 Tax=Niabella insulamsoli TaxID=3144874 RepID=UPI0031FBABF6
MKLLNAHLSPSIVISSIIVATTGLLGMSTILDRKTGVDEMVLLAKEDKDSAASVAAFEKVYPVLMHPRCMNCHPKGDVPLQGDDSHIHSMLPQRGPEGKGVLTMKCVTCHAPTGVEGARTPPGNPEWHMPPADMKMVFEGKTARELALQLVDFEKNGHKDMKALRDHAGDDLVKAGWEMGGDRELPPLSYEAFKQAWYAWIDNGAYAPSK